MAIFPRSPDTLGGMWPHFANLLLRSWQALVAGLGTTTLAICFGVAGFVFVLLLNLTNKLRRDGWKWEITVSHFSQNLRDSLLPTTIGTLFLWVALFGWFVVKTVYDDHHDSTARWRNVVIEKNNLKQELAKKDQYIQQLLQTRPQRTASPITPPKPEIPKLQGLRAIPRWIESSDPDWPWLLSVSIQTDETIHNPDIVVHCDSPCLYQNLDMPGYGGRYEYRQLNDKSVEVLTDNTLNPDLSLIVTLKGKSKFSITNLTKR